MRRNALIAGFAVGLVILALWAIGALAGLETAAVAAQREAQAALAGAIRALRGGEAGALAGLIALAFGYGVAHAAGPGHGKVLLAGYGAARRVPMARLAAIAVVASLAQATVAVALVHGGIAIFTLGRAQITGLAEGPLTLAGHVMIGVVGLWLVWRGAVGLRVAPEGQGEKQPHDHHSHGHDHTCAQCGHAHGPSIAQVARVTGWRDAAVLIAGIAVRPCTGALFLLILTAQFGLVWAGLAGAYAMGLGTATVTLGVAAFAVWAREGAFASAPGLLRLRGALPFVELAFGALIALAAFSLAWRMI